MTTKLLYSSVGGGEMTSAKRDLGVSHLTAATEKLSLLISFLISKDSSTFQIHL